MDPVDIQPLSESDLPEISRTRAQLSGELVDADPVALERRLRWLVRDNPARLRDVPPGWVLRTSSGHIAGSMLCLPQRFTSGGDIHTCLLSSGFYVEPPYRGLGLSIFLRYLQLGKQHLLLATTANPVSSELWKRFDAKPVAGTDREWFGVLRWRPILEDVIHRRIGASLPSRAAGTVLGPVVSLVRGLRSKAHDAQLERLRSIDEVPSITGAPGPALGAVRDRAFVQWRFFAHADRNVDVLRLTSAAAAGPCLVAVKHAARGYRQQIRALVVLDVWGARLPAGAVAAQLAAHYADRVDAIVFRCQDAEAEADLARAGFVRRTLEVPIAWTIDRGGHLAGRELRLSPADGDMAL